MNAPIERDFNVEMMTLGQRAKTAAREVALASTDTKNAALRAMAKALRASTSLILDANEKDMELARNAGRPDSFLDRLKLDEDRIDELAGGIEAIAELDDPVGSIIAKWTRPNGLRIERVRVPLGVIGIIFESRPNVTADAGALCLKAGNAAILRPGSESIHSAKAIHACLVTGLKSAGLQEETIQIVPTTDRAAVGLMLQGLEGTIDVIVPRGGKSLVGRVEAEARVPVFSHLEGICHIYLHEQADFDMARDIVINSKMRRTGICGAAETLLVDRNCAEDYLRPLVLALLEAGCEVRGDPATCAVDSRVVAAGDEDWGKEFLDPIMAVRIIDDLDAATDFIAEYGSRHTDAIITEDQKAADRFMNQVDSAIVLHNASTQFADGGEFGMGAEIGIATGKFHARGPVGVEQLTSFKYRVRGSGQTRH